MNPISTWMSVGCLSVALFAANVAAASRPPIPAGPQDQQKPTYSVAEYNAFQAAHNEQNATAKLKALDDFSAKYPTPDQMTPYVYRDYYLTYYSLKNYPQTLAFVDKLLALGDKVDFGSRLEALVARAQSYFTGSADKALQTPEQYTKARDSANQGLQMLTTWQKPDNMTADQFAAQKKNLYAV